MQIAMWDPYIATFSVKQVDRHELGLSIGVRAVSLKYGSSCCLEECLQIMK